MRLDIAEHCLDEQANGFQLESSLSRAAKGLERLCGVWAITTRSLVSHGTEVAAPGKRRWGDAHWVRGLSNLKIGGNWLKLALGRGYELATSLHVAGEADPEPAMASKSPHQKQPQLFFVLEFQNAVA